MGVPWGARVHKRGGSNFSSFFFDFLVFFNGIWFFKVFFIINERYNPHFTFFLRDSIGHYVGRSVRRSVRPKSLLVFGRFELKGEQISVTAPAQLPYCPCPPARDWCCRVYALVPFLDASTHLYMRVCPSVCRYVVMTVGTTFPRKNLQ